MRAVLVLAAHAATAEILPYSFTLCETASGGPNPLCPDGFTLTIAAPSAAVHRLSSIAPSQYQANWQRTGGVIDGGAAVELIMHEIHSELGEIAQFFDGFVVGPSDLFLPPIPIDFVSDLALAQGQATLPVFSHPLSTKDLTDYSYPVWQIYRAPWRREALRQSGQSPRAVFEAMLERLHKSDPLPLAHLDAAKIDGIRRYGHTEGLSEWAVVDAKVARKRSVVPLELSRSVRMTGLTFKLDQKIKLPSQHDLISRGDCQLMLDQLLPRSLFIDQDEALDHAERANVSYVFPQFHDIELPTHLATPVVYRTVFSIAEGARELIDVDLQLHDRYIIDNELEEYNQIDLEPPSASVVCGGLTDQRVMHLAVFEKVTSSPVSSRNPNDLLITGLALRRWPLPYLAAATSAVIIITAAAFVRSLLPVILLHSPAGGAPKRCAAA